MVFELVRTLPEADGLLVSDRTIYPAVRVIVP
jgi:hypothetical protein